MTFTSITVLRAASSSKAVFLAELCSYSDVLVCFVRLVIPLFCTVAVLWAACTDLPVALRSGYSGHFSLIGVSWSGTAQNIVPLMYVLMWWQWKMLESVRRITFSVLRKRDIPVTHITVLFLHNVL